MSRSETKPENIFSASLSGNYRAALFLSFDAAICYVLMLFAKFFDERF